MSLSETAVTALLGGEADKEVARGVRDKTRAESVACTAKAISDIILDLIKAGMPYDDAKTAALDIYKTANDVVGPR